jgi:hypothetical protein
MKFLEEMKIEIEPNSKQKKKMIKSLKKKGISFKVIDNESPSKTERKKVDFGAKKTEAGWNEWMDRIVLSNVPKWFEFIGWLFLLGAMSFIAATTNNIYVRILYGVSYIFLTLYLLRYFLNIDFTGFSFIKSVKIQLFLSMFLSAILATGSYLLIKLIIPHFTS